MMSEISNIQITQGLMGKTSSLLKLDLVKSKSVYVGLSQESVNEWVKEKPDYKVVSTQGNGFDNFIDLIFDGYNVAITWKSFFYHITKIVNMKHITSKYNLILDNCLEVINQESLIPTKEIKALLKNGLLVVDNDGKCSFNTALFGKGDHWKNLSETHFGKLQYFCDAGNLYLVNNSVLINELPTKALMVWNKVYITSSFFTGSHLQNFFDKNHIEYTLENLSFDFKKYKQLINIYDYDEKLSLRDLYKKSYSGINAIGYDKNSLSTTNILKNKDTPLVLKNNMHNYFKNKVRALKGERMWTSLKVLVDVIGGNRFENDWLAFNNSDTKSYTGVNNLAYLMNVFPPTFLKHFSKKKGYPIDQDMYALSEMVQWIWRSAIRNGEEINIYIPSSRMRQLLIDWLNGKYDIKNEVENERE
jgi:arsenate reductase-like glutaredoxin family protein